MSLIKKNRRKPKTADYLKWLGDHGFFASLVYMEGLTFILAVKGGKPFAICTDGRGHNGRDDTLDQFERAGGTHLCVKSIGDLECFMNTGGL